MILMFAGSGAITPHVIKHGGSRLHSFLNERNHIARWTYPNSLMVDSGAHSWNKLGMHSVGGAAKSSLPNIYEHMKAYMDFMEAHKEKPFVFVELDCYGHLSKDYLDGIYRDVMSMKGRKFQFIRVYHPAIDAGSLETLKEWVDEGQQYIGVGNDSQPFYGNIFRITKASVKLHCFACTKMDVLGKYPFYSVDSTTALAPGRHGGALVDGRYVGRDTLRKMRSVELVQSVEDKTDQAVQQILRAQSYFTDLWAKRGITWQ